MAATADNLAEVTTSRAAAHGRIANSPPGERISII
jgi:hypothetical protein